MNDLELALAAARAGAAVVARGFGADRSVTYKRRSDPVTDTDRASEQAVIEVLRSGRPDDSVLAEESGAGGDHARRWIVDPLDGTVNFVHGIPHVAVSVALWEGDHPVAAAIVDAIRGEEFTAAAGEGASLDGDSVTVSAVSDLSQSVVAIGFPYDHHLYADAYAANVGAVLAHVNGIRRLGSAALDLAWVAAGRFDAYWEMQVAPWDQAAGILIVREAGGVVTDLRGRPALPTNGPVVSGNPHLHRPLLDLVAASAPAHIPGASSS